MAAADEAAPAMQQLAALCTLGDATRRALYDHVIQASAPVSREQAAAAVGVDRSLAAYHLDKLVDEGLLVASFARPEGRGGPGAGRPAKYYRRADREFAVSIPPREYQLAAQVLARAAGTDATGAAREWVQRTARQVGRELAGTADGTDLTAQLKALGFEPYDDDGVTRLRNCPFHQLARDHTELVCGMNLGLLSGLTEALGVPARPRLDPGSGRCCVALDHHQEAVPAREDG